MSFIDGVRKLRSYEYSHRMGHIAYTNKKKVHMNIYLQMLPKGKWPSGSLKSIRSPHRGIYAFFENMTEMKVAELIAGCFMVTLNLTLKDTFKVTWRSRFIFWKIPPPGFLKNRKFYGRIPFDSWISDFQSLLESNDFQNLR